MRETRVEDDAVFYLNTFEVEESPSAIVPFKSSERISTSISIH